jgi:hypothetical protein
MKKVLEEGLVIEVENIQQAQHITSIMNEIHGTYHDAEQWFSPEYGIKFIGVKQKKVFDFDQVLRLGLVSIQYDGVDFEEGIFFI